MEGDMMQPYEKIQNNFLSAIAISGLSKIMNFEKGLTEKSESELNLKQKPEEKIVKTCCRACIANCGVIAHVKNGRVVRLEGNPEDPMSKGSMCAKGLSGIQALYHPNRTKYPLMRVGKRGENKWKRISWEKALDIIAQKLMDTREKYGAESVVCSTGGGGNPEIWSIARFCNVFGTPNWFEPGCAQCYLPRVLAYKMMYGGGTTSIADSEAQEIYYPEDTPMKSLVLWGSAPSYSCPASGGGAVAELRGRGVKTVVIDPRFTPDAAKSDVWLPIRPGTDVALMLAWIRYIISHELFNRDFVLQWTNLPFLVDTETNMLLCAEKEHPEDPDVYMVWDRNTDSVQPMPYPWEKKLAPVLAGSYVINGREYKTGFQLLRERVEPYTLKKAAEICWLEEDKIEEAICIYAKNTPGSLSLGVATDQNPNSVQAAMSAVTLDILMGNVEKPGNLIQRFQTSPVFDTPHYIVPIASKMLPREQLEKRLGGNEYKGLHIWYAAHPSSILEAILSGKPYKPRVWIDRSGNKLGTLANSSAWLTAIEQMDFIVHMYMYPTSFSSYADILLPAEEWLETNMIVETCNKLFARQSVAHLWETMDETLFWSKLAKRCADLGHENCQKAFDPEYMGKDLAYWDNMEDFLDTFTGRIGMTWKEFAEKAPFEFMPEHQWKSYYAYKKINQETGLPAGFDTPSGKLEVYLESMITLGRTGQPFSDYPLPPASKDYDPLPYYMEPFESPLKRNAVSKEFPLVMTNGRLPFFHHTTLRNIPWLREIYPVPEIWIHPNAARAYGIAQEDWVWVESKRGKIRARANVTEGINPGVVYMERFWNPETLGTETQGFKEMNVNMLSKADAPYNDIVGTYTLRGFQVKVKKAEEGAPKGIWQKPEDFKPWLPVLCESTKEVMV